MAAKSQRKQDSSVTDLHKFILTFNHLGYIISKSVWFMPWFTLTISLSFCVKCIHITIARVLTPFPR